MKNCKHCNQEFNQELVERMLGKESAPAILGFCSAQCYTIANHLAKTTFDSDKLNRDITVAQLMLNKMLDYSKLDDPESDCTKWIQDAIGNLDDALYCNSTSNESPESDTDIFEINDER